MHLPKTCWAFFYVWHPTFIDSELIFTGLIRFRCFSLNYSNCFKWWLIMLLVLRSPENSWRRRRLSGRWSTTISQSNRLDWTSKDGFPDTAEIRVWCSLMIVSVVLMILKVMQWNRINASIVFGLDCWFLVLSVVFFNILQSYFLCSNLFLWLPYFKRLM